MITEIQVENVRLFEGGDWVFPIHLLEVFCGTNSAGKSTLLKVLLLLRQSAILPESQRESEGRLRFTSSQADLGNYLSFVSDNDPKKDITISVTIEDVMGESAILWMKSIKDKHQDKPRKGQNLTLPYQLKSTFSFGLDRQPSNFSNKRLHNQEAPPTDPRSQGFLKRASFEIVHSGETLLSWMVISSLTESDKVVDRYELLVSPEFAEAAMPQLRGLGKEEKSQCERFQARMRGIFPDGLRAGWVKSKGKKPRGEETFYWPLPPQINFAIEDLRFALQQIHYLGPLRTPAKRYYVTNLDDTPDLDSTGEFLPSILHQKGEVKVLGISKAQELDTLESGLNVWLHFLRKGERPSKQEMPKEIELSTTKGVLIELLLKTPSGTSAHALADSGFGYSQVLPILVRGLLAKKGSTLIIEQPELHLNPALQVRLASFFIELVRAGKQVLIETHSEHIVNALRVLAAEDDSNTIAAKLGIVFIEMGSNIPIVRKIGIAPDGTIPEWPPSFFGEAISLTGRLFRAQSKFRTSPPPSS